MGQKILRISGIILGLSIFNDGCAPNAIPNKSQIYGTWEQGCHEESAFGKREYRIDRFSLKETAELNVEYTFFEDSSCETVSRKQFISGTFITGDVPNGNDQSSDISVKLDLNYSEFFNQPLSDQELSLFKTAGYLWNCSKQDWSLGEKKSCGSGDYTAYTTIKSVGGKFYMGWPAGENDPNGSTPETRLTTFLDLALTSIGNSN